MMQAAFCCPVCAGALAQAQHALRCKNGHSFDRAREGHTNLLLPNRMHAKHPGDSKEMVQARHRLLESGAYAPFGAALGKICADLSTNFGKGGKPLQIVDAGCGEGYYDAAVSAALAACGCPYQLAALDISKAAVRLGAKRNLPSTQFAVGSSFALPLQAGWAQLVLNIFSPLALEEFQRVLCKGGFLVYAVPTASHLLGLKQLLYAQPYQNPQQTVEYPGFKQVDERIVESEITLEGTLIADLFAMTPYYWKTPADGAQRLAKAQALTTQIGFRFLVFQKL